DVVIGLSGYEVGTSLQQLLVDFRSFDFGEELAFFDARADVEVPALQVAVGARVNWSVNEGYGVAGQRDFLGRSVGDGMHDGDSGDGGVVRGAHDVCFRIHPGADAEEDDERNDGDRAGGNPPGDGPRGRQGGGGGVGRRQRPRLPGRRVRRRAV